MKTVIGVDGCKGGWCAAIWNGTSYHLEVHETIAGIATSHPQSASIWIDIPIGHTDQGFTRTVDKAMRSMLPVGKKSSVFTAPCRAAAYASNYQEAKKRNLAATGKSLSMQSWNICSKIREVDTWLMECHADWMHRVFESHPELCFLQLDQPTVPFTRVLKSKKTRGGRNERLHILEAHGLPSPLAKKLLGATADDMLDALAMMIRARACQASAAALIENEPKTKADRPIQTRVCY